MERDFGERLYRMLEEKNMTQKTLALKAGVTEASMSHYIKGDRMPRAKVLAAIADALGTTSDYLMYGKAESSEAEIQQAVRLIARNSQQISREDKLKIVSILFGDE